MTQRSPALSRQTPPSQGRIAAALPDRHQAVEQKPIIGNARRVIGASGEVDHAGDGTGPTSDGAMPKRPGARHAIYQHIVNGSKFDTLFDAFPTQDFR